MGIAHLDRMRERWRVPTGRRLPPRIRSDYYRKTRLVLNSIAKAERLPSHNQQCQRWRLGRLVARMADVIDDTATELRRAGHDDDAEKFARFALATRRRAGRMAAGIESRRDA